MLFRRPTKRSLRSVPGAAVTGPAMWAAATARVAQWEWRARHPEAVQRTTLMHHVEQARATEFGKAHRFGSIHSYEDFRDRVPLRTYADFEPDLERMRRGERDVLWPGLIPYYGQSSGTSHTAAMHKFLPVSREQIGWQQKAGFDVVARYLTLSGNRRFSGGYTLGLLPPGIIKPEGPVGVGSNPGIMLNHLPLPARLMTLPRPPIRDIEDYDEKLSAMAESYLDYDIRALTGTTCWFSIFFDRALAAARARGIPARTIEDIWPNLHGLFGGGIPAEPYRKLIDERVGKPTILIDNYNATEGGIFAATDRLGRHDMMMIPDRGVFYEFVPRDEHGNENPRRLPLWEVERGGEYSVAVSTCSGLFAYLIGDFVRFTSVFPHRIEFAGRASGMLSVTQELTTASEIERAVSAACTAASCTALEYAAAADVGSQGTSKGRYVLFVEFERGPTDLMKFATAFDGELARLNRVYREHRTNNVAILPPEVVPLESGASRRFMQSLGQHSLQQKFPHIVDEQKRDILRTFAHGA